jgi:hypothetical protein
MKVRFYLALVVLVMAAMPVFAQEAAMAPKTTGGVMDLGAGFPTQIIDTVTTPEGKVELGVNAGYTNADANHFYSTLLQVNYGIMPNLQSYVSLPLIVGEGEVEHGQAFGTLNANFDSNWEMLYRINDETDTMPSFGIEGIAKAPTAAEDTGWNGTGSLVVTKTFGQFRAHLNAGYTTIGNDFGGNHYQDSYKLGSDYAVADNMLVIVDAFSNRSLISGDHRTNGVEAGMRYGLSDVDVISFGVGTGFGPSIAVTDLTATIGYQRLL